MTEKCPYYSEDTHKAWCDLFTKVERWEKQHHTAPEIAVEGSIYPNLMMERTTCMAKEIAKLACSCRLDWLPNNSHIMEEIGLLPRDMTNLKHDLKIFHARQRSEQ